MLGEEHLTPVACQVKHIGQSHFDRFTIFFRLAVTVLGLSPFTVHRMLSVLTLTCKGPLGIDAIFLYSKLCKLQQQR